MCICTHRTCKRFLHLEKKNRVYVRTVKRAWALAVRVVRLVALYSGVHKTRQYQDKHAHSLDFTEYTASHFYSVSLPTADKQARQTTVVDS
jgi:hypothetical protein